MATRQSLADQIAAFQASEPPGPRAPRAKSARPEDRLHADVKKYLTTIIARPGVCSADGVVWYSVETRAKRSKFEGARNKARGCISGCPDIDLYFSGRAYKIELKAAKGTVSDSQDILHAELARANVPVIVAKDIDTITTALISWGVPTREAI